MLCARRDGGFLLGLPMPCAAAARLSPVAKLLDRLVSSAAGRQELVWLLLDEHRHVSRAARCSARRHHIVADAISCHRSTFKLHCIPSAYELIT